VPDKDVGRKNLGNRGGARMMPDSTLDLAHYLSILKRRQKCFIIAVLAVMGLAVLLAGLWPAAYESSSTILIEEQQIPPEFIKSTVTGFADHRIQSLTQQILSRVKLWQIITQFNLYPDLRANRAREEVIEKMRDNIKFTTISAELADTKGGRRPAATAVTIAFAIAYRGDNPGTVQKVAETLASLYLEQNLKAREAQAQSTTKFFEAELKIIQERVKGLGDQITAFKKRHEGLLPDQQPFNQGQGARLEVDLKQLDAASRNAEDRRIYLQGQLATVKPDTPLIGATGERIMAPGDRLKALRVTMTNLQSKFSDGHPDVRRARREIAALQKMVGPTGGAALRRQKLSQLRGELAEKQGSYTDQHPEVKKLQDEIARLEQKPKPAAPPGPSDEPENPAYISLSAQVKAAEADIASLRQQQAGLQARLHLYRQRLEDAPKVEQEYLTLMRDYQNAYAKHQEVMNKILEARIAEGMEEHQKGGKFTLIDPASYPEIPVSPNRWLILAAGVILSLGVGFGAVALAEHLDHSVQSSDELTRLTGLPVLGAIIRVQTNGDAAPPRSIRKLPFVHQAWEKARWRRRSHEPATAVPSREPPAAPCPGRDKVPGLPKTPEDTHYTCTRTVAVDMARLRRNRLIVAGSNGNLGEAYKLLRTRIFHRTRQDRQNALMLTSPLPHEGKTLTAINLAIAISQRAGQTVLLVDGDLRRPSICRYLGLPPGPGLMDYLTTGYPLAESLVHPEGLTNLVVLPAGRSTTQAAELLSSSLMANLVQELKHFFPDRYLLFDLPPLLYADPLAIAHLLDGIILVVEAGSTPREEITRAQALLTDFPVLGWVLNKIDVRAISYDHYAKFYPG
jgi:polysaccharide biosynthesis transport protein